MSLKKKGTPAKIKIVTKENGDLEVSYTSKSIKKGDICDWHNKVVIKKSFCSECLEEIAEK